MCIGHGRLSAAAPIARRAGIGARTLRPNAQEPAGVNPPDAPAAGPDADDLDHRRLERPTVDLPHGREPWLAINDHSYVCACAAHIECQHAVVAGDTPEGCRARHSRAGPTCEQTSGTPASSRERHQASVRLDDMWSAGKLPGGKLVPQVAHVSVDARADVGIEDGRAQPLVLPELGEDLTRQRKVDARALVACEVPSGAFVSRVQVGVEEADGQRLDAFGPQLAQRRLNFGFVKRLDDLAVGGQPFGDLATQITRDKGRRLIGEQVVQGGPLLAADLQQIPEAARREQSDPRPLLLQQGIGGGRGAVRPEGQLVCRGAYACQNAIHAFQDRSRWVARCGGELEVHLLTRRRPQHQVRERATDIDPELESGRNAVHRRQSVVTSVENDDF